MLNISEPPPDDGTGQEARVTPPRPSTPQPPRSEAQTSPYAETAEKKTAEATGMERIRFGLAKKVIILMLLVSLVPLAVYWWISFNQSNTQMKSDTEALGSQITKGLTDHVDEWIDKNVRVLKAMSKLQGMVSMNRLQQEPILIAVQKEYPWKYLVFTTDVLGNNVARSDGKPLKDYSDRQYYKDVINGKDPAWQTLIGKTSKKPAIVIAVPIKREGQIVGVLASAMTTDDISKRVAAWKRGETGHAFLVDEKGKVVAHQIHQFVVKEINLKKHPLVAMAQRGREGTLYFKDDKGKAMIGNVQKTKYKWALGIQQEESEAFAPIKKAQNFAYLVLGATVLVVLIIAWFLAKAIVTPIIQLTKAADRISIGELDVEISIKSKDEIAALGNAISRMQDSVRLSIERLRKK
jgi:methyl-accepting chemotaxis protein